MKFAQESFIKFQNVIPFEESRYTYKDGSGWNATTLYEQAAKEKAEPFYLYLNNIDISVMPFSIHDLYDFIVHCKRMYNSSIEYPVLLSETGCVLDGWHRIAKAILEGEDHVLAVRLIVNPPFDILPKVNK